MTSVPLVSYLILFAPGPSWRSGTPFPQQPAAESHAAYMRALHVAGTHERGVPLADGSGSVALVWAANLSEAQQLVERDPMVQAGVMTWRLFEQKAVAASPVARSAPASTD